MSRIYYYSKQTLFYLFLIIYTILLAKTLLFKYVSPFELFNSERMLTGALNLIPFKSIYEYFCGTNIWISFMNVIGNVVIFIPLGIYLQIFKRRKRILNSVILICALSLCVEVTQYILGIGAADIDDIILNTIGGLLGVFIYRILYFVLKKEDKVRTALTLSYCIVGVCFLCFLAFIKSSGLMIKIF